jgi:hypothetical protein
MDSECFTRVQSLAPLQIAKTQTPMLPLREEHPRVVG